MKAVRRRFQTLFQNTETSSEYNQYRCLNLDVLLTIFSYVDIKTLALCAAVCKNWKEAAYHPSLWRGVTASISADQHVNSPTAESFGERSITSYRIHLAYMDICSNPETRYGDKIAAQLAVLSRSVNIESLVITSESADAKEDANENHRNTTPMLHTVKLGSDDLATTNLKYLAMVVRNRCPQLSLDSSGYQFTALRQLSLCAYHVDQTYCDSEFPCFDDLFSVFPNLIDLELSGVYCSALFDSAPKSTNHNLERLALMQDDLMAGNRLINRISFISYHFPNLRHLDIEFRHWKGWTPDLAVLNFPFLESLKLTSSRRLYDYCIVIASLFTNSPRLTALELGFSDYLDRKSLFERNIGKVLEFFPKLALLRLQNRASDPSESDKSQALVKIVRTMTQLDTLVLLGNWRLTDQHFRTICDSSISLSRLVVSWYEWKRNYPDYPANLGQKALWKQNYLVMCRRQNWELTREFLESHNEIFGTKRFHTSQSKVLLCCNPATPVVIVSVS